MDDSKLKNDWLISNSVVAFIGALLIAQTPQSTDGKTELILGFSIPSVPTWWTNSSITILLAISLILVLAAYVPPLRRLTLQNATLLTPTLGLITWAAFTTGFAQSLQELSKDQWWSSLIILGGLAFIVFLFFRLVCNSATLMYQCIHLVDWVKLPTSIRLIGHLRLRSERQLVDVHSSEVQCQRVTDNGTGLYVDVENLNSDGQTLIQSLVHSWPVSVPKLSRLTLYVKAAQVELWRLWAASRFGDIEVVVKGTQHFSMSSTKNSADIAIATNAIADLIFNRISHVAVFSDDSDFISLYAAIRDDPDIPLPDGDVPFLWIVTSRQGSLSATVKQFFPVDALHIVNKSNTSPKDTVATSSTSTWDEIANAILEEIPVGSFKSTDCQSTIKKRWPDHSLSKAGGPQFGIEFKSNIWPVLEKVGVKIRNPGKKPVQYEMTSEAKNSIV